MTNFREVVVLGSKDPTKSTTITSIVLSSLQQISYLENNLCFSDIKLLLGSS